MKRQSQKQMGFSLLEQHSIKKSFGGSLLQSHPKVARPISLKAPMHLVLRSSLARGPKSFLKPQRAQRVFDIVKDQAERFGVRLYRYANGGNHLHLVILPHSRQGYKSFVRAITGLIARLTLDAQRGAGLALRFWDARPFSRLVAWGRDFQGVSRYLLQNTLEAVGFVPYRSRGGPTQIAREGPTSVARASGNSG